MLDNRSKLKESLKETLSAVLPIIILVLLLSFTIAPISPAILMEFLIGAVMLIVGMTLFSIGAEIAMTPIGERVGTTMTKSRNLFIMILVSFILGLVITVSEPDLQVLAEQVPAVPGYILIIAVAAGVGFFLVIAILRMLFGMSLPPMLLIAYALVFIMAYFVPGEFLSVAFDSGGVTTGPMTVPFIMAFGVGISAIRNDERAAEDSFGLVSLCSVGPIIAVLIMGMIYHPGNVEYYSETIQEVQNSVELGSLFFHGIPTYLEEMAVSLLPILIFFLIFQLISRDINKKTMIKIVAGLVYTYIGLVLFLTGVNVGFMPAGNYLGQVLAGLPYAWIIVPIGMVIGYFIVQAEPAVFVLTKQVEEITSGAIAASAMQASLSVGVALSIGISMFRVLTGISVMWFIVPGYAVALILTFFVPRIFTAIAFDSGGVASGPMTATFLLPFAMGACNTVGGNIITDAFGVVAMVAMTPLITIQVLGVIYRVKEGRLQKEAGGYASIETYGDMEIIEL